MAKSALFCVTMGGLLKMYYHQNDGKMEDKTIDLESICSSDELVTHASLATDKSELVCLII